MSIAADVAADIRSRFTNDPGAVKVHKLLYYCQAWHYLWTGERMFPERIEAWDNGPVVAALWRAERYEPRTVSPEPLGDLERRTVDYAIARYGHRWAPELIGDTHAEDPWRDAYARGQNTEITLDAMQRFFSSDDAADQAWFWDPKWQAGEREADEDIRQGRTELFLTDDDFIASL